MKKLIRMTTVPGSFGLLKGQLKYMSQSFNVIAISSGSERLDRVSKEEGVTTIPIEITRTISPLKDLKALWQLYKLFRKEKPEIVHTHTPKAGTLGMMAAWMARVPIRMHTIAGLPLLEATGVKRWVLDTVEKATYACATKIYPNSFAMQDIILQNGYTRALKLMVIGNGSSNGIDTSEFNPMLVSEDTKLSMRRELGIADDDFVFLFVGRMVTDKGINELVEAFVGAYNNTCTEQNNGRETNIPRQRKLHLVLVGEHERELDPLFPKTEKIIDTHSNIKAVGFKSNVIDYFAMADVLTFPSYREGFPNVVMQAAAMQLNAIVSDINGCNEIISNGDNGWIVPPKNVEQLRERMEWCFNNQEESVAMGQKSRAVMIEKYERTYVWGEILEEYRRNLNTTL